MSHSPSEKKNIEEYLGIKTNRPAAQNIYLTLPNMG